MMDYRKIYNYEGDNKSLSLWKPTNINNIQPLLRNEEFKKILYEIWLYLGKSVIEDIRQVILNLSISIYINYSKINTNSDILAWYNHWIPNIKHQIITIIPSQEEQPLIELISESRDQVVFIIPRSIGDNLSYTVSRIGDLLIGIICDLECKLTLLIGDYEFLINNNDFYTINHNGKDKIVYKIPEIDVIPLVSLMFTYIRIMSDKPVQLELVYSHLTTDIRNDLCSKKIYYGDYVYDRGVLAKLNLPE